MPKIHYLPRLVFALFVLALASRAFTSDKVTLRISPSAVEFHAEGGR